MCTLQEIDRERAYPVIVDLVSDPDAQVRRMVATLLSSYPQKDSCELYRALVRDPHPLVRAEAGARVLFGRKCQGAREWVEQTIADEEDYVTRIRLEGALERVYGVSSSAKDSEQ